VLPTPSQTVGPFFNIGLPGSSAELVAPASPGAIRLWGHVYDGEGEPVIDALLEIWQANSAGRYNSPEDPRDDLPLDESFRGFGRAETDDSGRYEFVTVKPGPVEDQAPHIVVAVFARGLLKHLATRVYFPGEGTANESDPVLAAVDPERRGTVVAREEEGGLRFDVHLQGERETVFFDV